MELIKNQHIKNITSLLKHIGERVEGNLICDIDPDNWVYEKNMSKIINIQNICRNKKKIIEIGVNACHSLLIMLLENPNAEYLLFDLNNHAYTQPAIQYVKTQFPTTKITVIFGSSVDTVKKYILDNPHELATYDLCHLDGGHTENIFSVDYTHMKKLVKRDGCVIFDDYDYHEIRSFIEKKIGQKEIKEVHENVIKNDRHFVYQYV